VWQIGHRRDAHNFDQIAFIDGFDRLRDLDRTPTQDDVRAEVNVASAVDLNGKRTLRRAKGRAKSF